MGVSWRVDGDVVGMMMNLIVDVSSTWCYMYCYFACYLCVCHVRIKGGYGSCCLMFTCSEKTACVIAKHSETKKARGFEQMYCSGR